MGIPPTGGSQNYQGPKRRQGWLDRRGIGGENENNNKKIQQIIIDHRYTYQLPVRLFGHQEVIWPRVTLPYAWRNEYASIIWIFTVHSLHPIFFRKTSEIC
jgi:hypothetical protein